MKSIGGYFELELSKGAHSYHDTPYIMKSGRSSLHYILSIVKPALVHIPYYTCDSLLEPFEVANVRYEYYDIHTNLCPKVLIDLKPGEYFLYVNYMGLKGAEVARLSEKYGDKLIVDCTQAFFTKGNGVSWFFNSCRKIFGVPDGSYLYCPSSVQMPAVENRNEGYIADHLLKRFNGHTKEGYNDFLQNEIRTDSGLQAMSKLSEYLLSGIDYKEVIKIRRANYQFLHERLKDINLFQAGVDDSNVPICYPLLLDREIDKSLLFDKDIFIPTFWKDTRQRGIAGFEFEKELTDKLWPLPIDHRYSTGEMELLTTALTRIIA